MQLKLVIVRGEGEPKEVDLTLPAVIGRSRDVDVTIGHPLVSRRHCELSAGDDGSVVARDLGSLNGTFVGQDRIEEATLKPGGLLTIGNVTFRAIYAAPSAGDELEFPDFEAVEEAAADEEPVEEFVEADEETISFDETQPVPAKPVPAQPAAKQSPAKPAASPAPEKKKSGEDDFDLSWLDEPGEEAEEAAEKKSRSPEDSDLGNFLKGLE